MLKKILALATSAAMVGANVAAHAMNGARSFVRTVTGSPAPSGEDIQPSIPPLPPEPRAPRAVARPAKSGSAAARKPTKARVHAKRASHRKPRRK